MTMTIRIRQDVLVYRLVYCPRYVRSHLFGVVEKEHLAGLCQLSLHGCTDLKNITHECTHGYPSDGPSQPCTGTGFGLLGKRLP